MKKILLIYVLFLASCSVPAASSTVTVSSEPVPDTELAEVFSSETAELSDEESSVIVDEEPANTERPENAPEEIDEPVRRITSVSYRDCTQIFIYTDDTAYPSMIEHTERGNKATFYLSYTNDYKLKEKKFIREIDGAEVVEAKYEYDDNGFMIYSYVASEEGPATETYYTRDDDGKVITCISGSSDEHFGFHELYYEYDGNSVTITDSDRQSNNYVEYDSDGRIIHSDLKVFYPEIIDYEYEYAYFPNGLVIVTLIDGDASYRFLKLLDQGGTIITAYSIGDDYYIDEDGYPVTEQVSDYDAVITYETIGV